MVLLYVKLMETEKWEILSLDCHLLSNKCNTTSKTCRLWHRSHSITTLLPHFIIRNQGISKSWAGPPLIRNPLLTNITVWVKAKGKNLYGRCMRRRGGGKHSYKVKGLQMWDHIDRDSRRTSPRSWVKLLRTITEHFAKEGYTGGLIFHFWRIINY